MHVLTENIICSDKTLYLGMHYDFVNVETNLHCSVFTCQLYRSILKYVLSLKSPAEFFSS